ncbi:MAG: cadherin-like beta sandwich domain-containing protein [Lachnospiraceae bacterium]
MKHYIKQLLCGVLALSLLMPVCHTSAAEASQAFADFPKSYREALSDIHKQYPNWKFIAVDTGLDWNTVIQKESAVRVNTIESNLPNGGTVNAWSVPFSYLSTDSGAYNWATDTYTLIDGTNRYTPEKSVIAYYMDPRNFLTLDKIFQFESLAYDEGQTIEVVRSILSDTFMNGTYSYKKTKKNGKKKTITEDYAETFMKAGKNSGVSPYFLATRVRQELGLTGSASVSGTVKGYKGYYNYYNIGASDGAGSIERGLLYAKGGTENATTYNRPWNTPYKAILGGANWIAEGYIHVGQNTKYFQKWSVVEESKLYWHQYMSNIQAPVSEAARSYEAYRTCDSLNQAFVFRIPVYNNMPENACSLPKMSGNPNSYVKSVSIQDNNGKSLEKQLNESFTYSKKSYQLTVDKSVSSVTVKGTPISRFATMTTNNKTVSLNFGETKTVKIKCKSQSGKTTTYSFKITREAAPTDEIITNQ